MPTPVELLDQLWDEAMQTSKPGTWAKANPAVPGHWLNSRQAYKQLRFALTQLSFGTSEFGSGTFGNKPVPGIVARIRQKVGL